MGIDDHDDELDAMTAEEHEAWARAWETYAAQLAPAPAAVAEGAR